MRSRTSAAPAVLWLIFLLGAADAARATQVKIFQTQSQERRRPGADRARPAR